MAEVTQPCLPGRTDQAFSFTAQAFPSGPLRISLLSPPVGA
jgi:hypothetical protein